jgi:hypothetical protein
MTMTMAWLCTRMPSIHIHGWRQKKKKKTKCHFYFFSEIMEVITMMKVVNKG